MNPQQPPRTSASRPANSPGEEVDLCKKYIWGVCDKYEQCRFRHELDIEQMKNIIQFCHDYQNNGSCTRENCRYLHTTKEEQNLFLATGEIPRVLAERHAAMAASAPNSQADAETIPQIAMFIANCESYMQPSTPWPPLPPQQGGLPPVVTAPPPPPPPPPAVSAHQPLPPQASTSNAAQLRPAPPTYSAIASQAPVLFSMSQPPPIVPASFDASVPPPPIPTHLQPASAQLKRKIETVNGNAGSSKKKPECSELSESRCEICAQREIRIQGYKQQMEVLHNEEEAQILHYKKKLQEYEMGRDLLKTIVGPELFSVLDKLIEGSQTPQLAENAPFNLGDSAVSKRLFQLLLISAGSRNMIDSVAPPHVDETLNSFTRRQNDTQSTDMVKLVIDTLRNGTSPDKAPNGQKQASVVNEPPRYDHPGAAVPSGMASYPVAGPSGYSAPAPAPAYPVYHPGVPPPHNRPPHYYPQPPGAPYNGERMNGAGGQGMQPPTSGVMRPNHPTQNYYMGRYPHPPYFPPYQ